MLRLSKRVSFLIISAEAQKLKEPGGQEMKRKKTVAAGMVLAVLLSGNAVAAAERESSREPETIVTGLIFRTGSENYGAWGGTGAEKLLRDTGIRLEFYPNGNGEKLRQYMAAGTLPDFIGFETSQAGLLKNTDLLINLDDYKEFLPAVFENQAYQQALNYLRDSFGGETDGLYLLPTEVGKKSEEEYEWMPMLQWKPYEQAGCPEINTLLDYLDAAEEMLRYKPTTPLGDQVYGFSLFGNQDDCTVEEAGVLSYLYGVDTGMISPLIEMDGRTKKIRPVTDEESCYKKALSFYFEANQRGLLDPDSRTQTFDGLKQKYDSGRILFANYSWIVKEYNQLDELTATDYVPVVAADMKIYREPGSAVGTDFYYGVSHNASDPQKACEVLNWLYQEETIKELYSHPEEMEPFELLGLSKTQAGVRTDPLFYRELEEDGFQEKETMGAYLRKNNRIQEGNSVESMLPPDPMKIQNLTKKVGETVRELSWDMIYAENPEEFEEIWKKMQRISRVTGMEEIESYYQNVWAEALLKEETYGETS